MHNQLLLLPLLFSSVLSATVTWTTYTDAACTVLCPVLPCTTTLDTADQCNRNSEASNTNLVCGTDQITYNNYPNTGTSYEGTTGCVATEGGCFVNTLPVGVCTYFPGPVPTWKMIVRETYTCAGNSSPETVETDPVCTGSAPTPAPTPETPEEETEVAEMTFSASDATVAQISTPDGKETYLQECTTANWRGGVTCTDVTLGPRRQQRRVLAKNPGRRLEEEVVVTMSGPKSVMGDLNKLKANIKAFGDCDRACINGSRIANVTPKNNNLSTSIYSNMTGAFVVALLAAISNARLQ